jgi:DNA-binding CsgD family transcriptional regulator
LISRTIETSLRGAAYLPKPVYVSRTVGRPLRISSAPIPRRISADLFAAGSEAVAILFIKDTEEGAQTLSGLLRIIYNLTPAEIRVALLLQVGKSPAECAEINRVSVETVGAQLKAIFQKTRVRRQSQLLQLLTELS